MVRDPVNRDAEHLPWAPGSLSLPPGTESLGLLIINADDSSLWRGSNLRAACNGFSLWLAS